MSACPDEGRRQGRIEERGNTLRVVVYVGLDPVTGRRSYLREKINGTDKTTWRETRKIHKPLGEPSAGATHALVRCVTFGHTVDEYLPTVELEDGTREMYRGYLERNIRPGTWLHADQEDHPAHVGESLRRAAPLLEAL